MTHQTNSMTDLMTKDGTTQATKEMVVQAQSAVLNQPQPKTTTTSNKLKLQPQSQLFANRTTTFHKPTTIQPLNNTKPPRARIVSCPQAS